jgi:hypothetical protein
MWGDAQVINGVAASPTAATGTVITGADTFVFAPGSGNDDINDFRQSDHDKIDVRAYGFHNIADMTITADGGGNTKIAFDANDNVTLVGINNPISCMRLTFFLFDLLQPCTAEMKPHAARGQETVMARPNRDEDETACDPLKAAGRRSHPPRDVRPRAPARA